MKTFRTRTPKTLMKSMGVQTLHRGVCKKSRLPRVTEKKHQCFRGPIGLAQTMQCIGS